jgi:hypothetical protein
MLVSRELKQLISQLSVGERLGLPEHEEWKDHVDRIAVPDRIMEVTEEQYYYWLEVLPPKFMSASLFCFAEGAEPFRVFVKDQYGRYWARQLTWDETITFCRLAGISLPN